jgi:hypothetical protein
VSQHAIANPRTLFDCRDPCVNFPLCRSHGLLYHANFTHIAFLLKKDYPVKMDHQPSFLYWQSLTAQHVDCRGHPSAAAI